MQVLLAPVAQQDESSVGSQPYFLLATHCRACGQGRRHLGAASPATPAHSAHCPPHRYAGAKRVCIGRLLTAKPCAAAAGGVILALVTQSAAPAGVGSCRAAVEGGCEAGNASHTHWQAPLDRHLLPVFLRAHSVDAHAGAAVACVVAPKCVLRYALNLGGSERKEKNNQSGWQPAMPSWLHVQCATKSKQPDPILTSRHLPLVSSKLTRSQSSSGVSSKRSTGAQQSVSDRQRPSTGRQVAGLQAPRGAGGVQGGIQGEPDV